MSEHSPFSKVKKIQIGVIARDMEKAIAYYESLGIGPFKAVKLSRKSRSVRGKPVEPDGINVRTMIADMGQSSSSCLSPVSSGGISGENFSIKRGKG